MSTSAFEAWVLAYVGEHPGVTTKAIAGELAGEGARVTNAMRAKVDNAIRRLRDRGDVEPDPGSQRPYRWRRTTAGQTPVRLSHVHARLAVRVLRNYIKLGELGEQSAELLAAIEAQLPPESTELPCR